MSMEEMRSYEALRRAQRKRDRALSSKVMSLEAAAALIADGEHVGIGGSMMSRTPMAMIWQLVRARRRNLICYRPITTSEGDILLGADLAARVVTSWFSQGIMWGISKVMRHHVERDPSRYDEWSHLALGMRLRAGAMGVPYLPMRPMLGSDVLGERKDVRTSRCPFTGEELLLVPALNPSTAIIHVHRCDAFGNAQIDGLPFMDPDLAMAADRVILTTERIVSNDRIRRAPDRTVIPFFCVDAVVEVPFGASPHECYGMYEPLMRHMTAYVERVNADPLEGMKDYLEQYYHAPASWPDFLNLIGMADILEAARLGRRVYDD